MVDTLKLPTWLSRLLARAQADHAAFNDMPGFVFGAAGKRMIDDGHYGDPEAELRTITDEDGTVWHAMNVLDNSGKR